MLLRLKKIILPLAFLAFSPLNGCKPKTEPKTAEIASILNSISVRTSDIKEKYNPDMRIAVIGAGASGLSAAYKLKELGYKNITVFEKGDDPGGKVMSINYDGNTLELGAVWIPAYYDNVRTFAKTFNVELMLADAASMSEETHVGTSEYMFNNYSKLEIAQAYLSFKSIVNNNGTNIAGFTLEGDPDLALPFSEYIKKKGIAPLAQPAQTIIVGCGYGFYEETPAIYIIKFMAQVIKGAEDGMLKFWKKKSTHYSKNGYQLIWKKVAETLDVKLNSEVTKIVRIPSSNTENSKIAISAGRQEYVFDRMVISFPPNQLAGVMDLTQEEKELFSKVETVPYYVTIFEAEGIKHKPWGATAVLLERNAGLDKAGHVQILGSYENLYKSHPTTYVSWQTSKRGISDEDVKKKLEEDIIEMGGKLTKITVWKKWDNYFPHISTQNLLEKKNGLDFYQRLNGLQGQAGTYYVGGLMNFESVEHTSDFATKLMAHHFSP